MTTKAFQKIYTKISQITKATCSLKAQGVGYDELAIIDGRLAQVVKIVGEDVTLQVFEGTGGIPTNAEVVFMGKAPTLKVSDSLSGRFFNAYGDPIDGGPAVEGTEVEIGGPSVNPVRLLPVLRVSTLTIHWYRVRRFLSLPILTSRSTRLWQPWPCVPRPTRLSWAVWV